MNSAHSCLFPSILSVKYKSNWIHPNRQKKYFFQTGKFQNSIKSQQLNLKHNKIYKTKIKKNTKYKTLGGKSIYFPWKKKL